MIDNGQHAGQPLAYKRKGDQCALHPKFCDDGLSFAIWEKFKYDPEVMDDNNFKTDPSNFPKKYIVSSGAEFDFKTAKSCPGFAIYRQVNQFIHITKEKHVHFPK